MLACGRVAMSSYSHANIPPFDMVDLLTCPHVSLLPVGHERIYACLNDNEDQTGVGPQGITAERPAPTQL